MVWGNEKKSPWKSNIRRSDAISSTCAQSVLSKEFFLFSCSIRLALQILNLENSAIRGQTRCFESLICAPCQGLKYTYATEYLKGITNATREYGDYVNTVVIYNFSDRLSIT